MAADGIYIKIRFGNVSGNIGFKLGNKMVFLLEGIALFGRFFVMLIALLQ